jgi:hypothetical protein
MANKIWNVSTDGNWTLGSNWNPAGVPISTDNVIISPGGTYTVTYNLPFSTIASLDVTSPGATLAFSSNDFLDVTGVALLTAGTIDLSNTSFLSGDSVDIFSLGTVNIANTGGLLATTNILDDGLIRGGLGDSLLQSAEIDGTGAVVADTGLLAVLGNVIGTSLRFTVSNGGRLLMAGSSIAAGNTFTIQGPAGGVGFATAGLSENIVGLNVGAAATNFIDVIGTGVTVTSGQTGTGGTGTIALSNGDTFILSGITNGASGWHVLTAPDALGGGTDVFLVCYARGTMIRTPVGELPVEKLRPGKQVMTMVDGQEVPQTVTWLGHRRIDLTAHARPETARPIRILRGAFADGMPHRDLVVSPDHAIFVDGKLICARQLVNGTTIRQELDWTAVDYYHVELDQHAIMVAEGLPAESYLDTGNSGFFANSGAPLVLHPDLTDESDYPTREAGSCEPFVWDEASVQPVWQQLADRAAAIGQPVPQRVTTTDASLRLVSKRTGRRTYEPVYSDSNLVIFMVPSRSPEVRLLSRAQSPTEARPWLDDRRRLGVHVKRIVLRGADDLREIPVDHPDLTRGWWAVERDGQIMSRWTDGEAVLPLPAMQGTVMLEIHLAGSMTYAVDAVPQDGTERRAA